MNTEKVKDAIDLMKQVYEYSCAGGNLHIVLDDHNIEDGNIQWCIDEAIGKYDRGSDNEEARSEIETALAKLLLTMTIEERVHVVMHNDIEKNGGTLPQWIAEEWGFE